MKRCPYCGAEYPDNVLVCETDQTPLESVTRKHEIVSENDKTRQPRMVSRRDSWLIFSGIPFSVLAIYSVMVGPSEHQLVGQNAEPYVVFFVPALIVIIAMLVFNHFPKRLVVPLGIIGWIITFVIVCSYSWS